MTHHLSVEPAWRRWGSYLSERQWGTVREDYSANGTAWDYFPFEHARLRAYRWGEDGLFGFCDDEAQLCFAPAFWNEADPFLKERLFGLNGEQGNHAEDVKELYAYLDNVPTHSYMKATYTYPQRAFPYDDLRRVNASRTRNDPEYELIDTGVFAENRYFDIVIEYAKADPDDILIRISATNYGPDAAPLHILPMLWFRNTWSWLPGAERPRLADRGPTAGHPTAASSHRLLGDHAIAFERDDQPPELLFTENDSNAEALWGIPNASPYVKDSFDRRVVHKDITATNPARTGTKLAAWYRFQIEPGETAVVRARFSRNLPTDPFRDAAEIFDRRIAETEQFYAGAGGDLLTDDETLVQRQAFAGLLWTKQHYFYDVGIWLKGDPGQPTPPASRWHGRNCDWQHLNNSDILLMPDGWEYPWYAAWDLAFHTVALSLIDPTFAKEQLILLLREWYMHPNGQLPAYEWALGDVNPPVHAWAAWRVYKIEKRLTGVADRAFLARVFHKLLLNFTWWVNRKDAAGRNVFQGGFLGLDNIGVFDRSKELPTGGYLEQSDATAWMGAFCLNMMAIALELAREEIAYEDVATKFFEHFLYITAAINGQSFGMEESVSLWDEADGFFYDVLHLDGGEDIPLKVRSLVGLMPLIAVETLEPNLGELLPNFSRRMRWFLSNRPQLAALVPTFSEQGVGKRRLLALAHGERLRSLLRRMLDENEFFGSHGIRSLSRIHLEHPYEFDVHGVPYRVVYEPAESATGVFGGNSNWRGPIWFPINFLLIEALERFYHYYGDDFTMEHPAGSGRMCTLQQIRNELADRLISIFLRDEQHRRPLFGGVAFFHERPEWHDRVLFHEYFHGDTGAGLGASHQTGWTALVAKLLDSKSRAGEAAKARSEISIS